MIAAARDRSTPDSRTLYALVETPVLGRALQACGSIRSQNAIVGTQRTTWPRSVPMRRDMEKRMCVVLGGSVLASLLAASPARAQPYLTVVHVDGTGGSGGQARLPAPRPDGRTFVSDENGGAAGNTHLDETVCSPNGPTQFNVQTTRYLGETNSEGYLIHWQAMVDEGLLGRNAHLMVQASTASNCGSALPTRFVVKLNGHALGVLRQSDSGSLSDTFDVPIEWVKFPAARGSLGQQPNARDNSLTIDAETPGACGCFKVDWISLGIRAVSPVMFIHGTGSNSGFWTRQLGIELFNEAHWPIDSQFSFSPSRAPITKNANALRLAILPVALSFGAQEIHLVSHSKGGLDVREYLAIHQGTFNPQFRVISLATLSTPHDGSFLADGMMMRWSSAFAGADRFQWDDPFPDGIRLITWSSGNGADLSDYRDLQTSSCAIFNMRNLPSLDQQLLSAPRDYRTCGGDADLTGDHEVSQYPCETEGMWAEAPGLQNLGVGLFAQVAYQTLYKFNGIRVYFLADNETGENVIVFQGIRAPAPVLNDCLCPVDSAHGITGGFASYIRWSHSWLGSAGGYNHINLAGKSRPAYFPDGACSITPNRTDYPMRAILLELRDTDSRIGGLSAPR